MERGNRHKQRSPSGHQKLVVVKQEKVTFILQRKPGRQYLCFSTSQPLEAGFPSQSERPGQPGSFSLLHSIAYRKSAVLETAWKKLSTMPEKLLHERETQ